MKKYIKSQREGSLIYEIERQEYSEKFRTPENYFAHATRRVWYSTTGFTVFVQYNGTFYMIDRVDGDQITTLAFDTVTAEEAAAAKMERAAQAMSEAQEHEAKTAAAALDYDTETAEAEAREARFSAAYAAILAEDAAAIAARAGISEAASIADTASEYAEQAREYARRATETAEQNARELEEQAETAAARAAFEDSRPTAEDIRAKFDNPYLVWDDDAAADPEDIEDPAPIYQRYELLAYLGEPDDYDVDAIEAEATRFTSDGARVWAAFGSDLAAIAERHELVTYYAI